MGESLGEATVIQLPFSEDQQAAGVVLAGDSLLDGTILPLHGPMGAVLAPGSATIALNGSPVFQGYVYTPFVPLY